MDRAPSFEARPGRLRRWAAPAWDPRRAHRHPLKAASFRTWPCSRTDVAGGPWPSTPPTAGW